MADWSTALGTVIGVRVISADGRSTIALEETLVDALIGPSDLFPRLTDDDAALGRWLRSRIQSVRGVAHERLAHRRPA